MKFKVRSPKSEFLHSEGFTLVEVLISVSLIVVVSFAFIALYAGETRLTRNNINTSSVYTELSILLNELTPTVSAGLQVLSSVNIGSNTYQSTSDSLVLSLPSIDGSGIPITGSTDSFVWQLNNNALEMIIDASSSSARSDEVKTLADGIQTLSFTYASTTDYSASEWVQLDISKTAEITGGTEEIKLTKKYMLRNK